MHQLYENWKVIKHTVKILIEFTSHPFLDHPVSCGVKVLTVVHDIIVDSMQY